MRILGTLKRLAAASNLSIHFSSKSMVVVLYFVGSSTIITYLSEYRPIIIYSQGISKVKSYDFSCRFSDFSVIILLCKSFYTTLTAENGYHYIIQWGSIGQAIVILQPTTQSKKEKKACNFIDSEAWIVY